MRKQTRLAVKIGFGFAVLIAILLLIGGYAMLQLRGIQVSSQDVTEEAVPLVLNAAHIERQALVTGTEDLRYQFTGDSKLVAGITANLAETKTTINDTLKLTAEHNLVNAEALTKQADEAQKAYAEQLRLTGEQVEKVSALRKQMEDSEERYHVACKSIYTSETQILLKFIDDNLAHRGLAAVTNSGGTKVEIATELTDHVKENTAYRDMIDLSHEAYIGMQQADIHRDPAMAEAILPNFDAINVKLEELKKTLDPWNVQLFDNVCKATKEYRAAMEGVITAWKTQLEL